MTGCRKCHAQTTYYCAYPAACEMGADTDGETAEQLRDAAALARQAADDPRFGNDDREPFWRAADLLDECAGKVEQL